MDRDREANTRCTWFTQIGYVHGVEEFSLIVKGLHKYIGSSSPLVSTSLYPLCHCLLIHHISTIPLHLILFGCSILAQCII
ncbi:hypothetical protein DVH24_019741 [Malus domestica]|uniref:Uncharacterized protein n=1 Tax=Malus domestica TaxID=3750 RepID=A0A498I6W9_MALDO|nr:hypothetical protein DVH24_019741 [Malus domestica]